MLKRIKIKNFKSHRNTSIEFSAGVNVMEGSPQAGKTNILRAMDLVVKNRPLGAGYIPDFRPNGCTTEIMLTMVEGHTVKLEKDVVVDKKKNTPSVSATRYTVDNREPTSNLSDIVNSTLKLDEINLQKQMDVPFLAVSSGGEVARYINKITKLNQSDEWVKKLSSMIRKHDETISICSENLDEIDSDLEKVSDLDAIKKLSEQASDLDVEIGICSEEIASLNKFFIAYADVVEVLSHEAAFKQALTCFDKAEKIDTDVNSFLEKRTVLSEYILIRQTLKETVSAQKKQTQLYHNVMSIEEDIKSIEKETEQLDKEYQMINKVLFINGKLKNLEMSRKLTKESYIRDLEVLKKCPLCFSDINSNQIEQIKRKL